MIWCQMSIFSNENKTIFQRGSIIREKDRHGNQRANWVSKSDRFINYNF